MKCSLTFAEFLVIWSQMRRKFLLRLTSYWTSVRIALCRFSTENFWELIKHRSLVTSMTRNNFIGCFANDVYRRSWNACTRTQDYFRIARSRAFVSAKRWMIWLDFRRTNYRFLGAIIYKWDSFGVKFISSVLMMLQTCAPFLFWFRFNKLKMLMRML